MDEYSIRLKRGNIRNFSSFEFHVIIETLYFVSYTARQRRNNQHLKEAKTKGYSD
jgi:hypothetical protein